MRLALVTAIGLFTCTTIHAQIPDSTTSVRPKPSPTQQAAHQLKTLEKKLRLTQDQVLQLQVILINRDVAIDSLRHNSSGDRRTENHGRRSIQQRADQQIDALLTDDQKTLYEQWKQEQRQKAALRRQKPGVSSR